MTRLFVAARTLYGLRTLGAWETGKREPSPNNLITLAQFYGVPPGSLLVRPASDWRLIDARYARGLRLKDLSEALRARGQRISDDRLSAIEKGATHPSGDLLDDLTEALHLPSTKATVTAWDRANAELTATTGEQHR